MSISSWKKRFYPVDVDEKLTNLEAVQHSLKKWRGLVPVELKKHGLTVTAYSDIADKQGSQFSIDSTSCALCFKHDQINNCRTCPLTRVRGGVRCDTSRKDEQLSPWSQWTMRQQPGPMIMWLMRAEQTLLKDQQRRKKNAG